MTTFPTALCINCIMEILIFQINAERITGIMLCIIILLLMNLLY